MSEKPTWRTAPPDDVIGDLTLEMPRLIEIKPKPKKTPKKTPPKS